MWYIRQQEQKKYECPTEGVETLAEKGDFSMEKTTNEH